jgi:thiol:disulfide interchange protein DsbD
MIRFVFLLLLVCSSAFADKDFSSWRKHSQGRLVAETDSLHPGNPGTIGFYVTLAPHWHTYWANPGDSGTALRISFKNSPGLKVKKVLMPVPERILTGPLVSFGYSTEVLFLIEVDVASSVKVGSTADFQAEAEWLVCEDVCIPAFDTVKLSLPVRPLEEVKPSAEFALFQKTRAALPQPKTPFPKMEERDGGLQLAVGDFAGRKFVEFFPFKNSGANNAKPKAISESPLILAFEKSAVPREKEDRVGVLVSKNAAGALEAWEYGDSGWSFDQEIEPPRQSLWWMILSAFIGGLILNLMPCVFPVLSIKLLSLLKHAESHPEVVRRENFAYVAVVLVAFLAIAGALIAVRAAGTLVGWGFQLQSPLFLGAMIWLFFALSLNLAGLFEIDFLDAGLGGRFTRLGGMTGSFFTGVLAVIVASPCTAPCMGVALGFGLTQSTSLLVLIFLSLGFGLAFPYLVFAVFPKLIRILPRPGAWMNTLKKVMALPLLLTTAWMIWILAQVSGERSAMVAVAVCAFIGLWAFLQKSFLKYALPVVLAAGFAGIYFSRAGAAEVKADLGDWLAYRADMPELKNERVLIDMTADWCLTCKVNERLVLDTPEVKELFKRKKITLIKGDWTQRNEEITRFLARYDRVGVPFYVLYSARHPEGQVLPEVLSKSTFMELISSEFPE